MNLRKPNMDVQTLLEQANDSITVKRVFGQRSRSRASTRGNR